MYIYDCICALLNLNRWNCKHAHICMSKKSICGSVTTLLALMWVPWLVVLSCHHCLKKFRVAATLPRWLILIHKVFFCKSGIVLVTMNILGTRKNGWVLNIWGWFLLFKADTVFSQLSPPNPAWNCTTKFQNVSKETNAPIKKRENNIE